MTRGIYASGRRETRDALAQVTRYVPTYWSAKSGLRTLMRGAHGRDTFDLLGEAEQWLDDVLANNADDRVRELYGDPGQLGVSQVPCWPGHLDPKSVYPDNVILRRIPGERSWVAAARAARIGDSDYPGIRAFVERGETSFARIDSAAYYEALEVLPPIQGRGWFAVSEPVCDSSKGTVYLIVRGSPDGAVVAYGTLPTLVQPEADDFARLVVESLNARETSR